MDINNEVNADVEVLDDSSGTFSSFDGSLSGTMDKLKQMTSIRHQRYMVYLTCFALGIFFMVYSFSSLYWSHESDYSDNNDNGTL